MFVYTIIDDHSRVAYAEICSDEKADTAIGVLRRAVAWFADRDVSVELVLSDNGSAYKSYARRLHRARDQGEEDPTIPTTDQREDQTLPPHTRRRLGLRPVLWFRGRTTRSTPRLAPLLQSSPAPLRHQSPTH